MINNVVMTGRLTRDIELKYSQSGVVVDNFAFLESKKNNTGGSSDSYVKAADPFQQMGSPIDTSDDDMPF